jgi:single-strand DNA-binding protein
MNIHTVVGNITADPAMRVTRKSGVAMARFHIAVNPRRRTGDDDVEQDPMFHRIKCFGQLAENVGVSLRKGMEVLAIGEWVDDSYVDENGQKQKFSAIEAKVVGVGLRWATASVTKTERPARVIPLPDQPKPSAEPSVDHESGEFSANTPPAEPVAKPTRATRKGEQHIARAG